MTDKTIIKDLEEAGQRLSARDEFLLESAHIINRHFPHCNWVGYYFLKEGRLHVGPYIGKPTPHTVIDPDQGICGAAVSQGKTIVVDDVNSDPRYLACSLETKSEIVIPIEAGGEIIGELDIDSEKKAAFTGSDRRVLEEAARFIGMLWDSRGWTVV